MKSNYDKMRYEKIVIMTQYSAIYNPYYRF